MHACAGLKSYEAAWQEEGCGVLHMHAPDSVLKLWLGCLCMHAQVQIESHVWEFSTLQGAGGGVIHMHASDSALKLWLGC